jgi:tetratricopeptide (TPR) repeat protein
MRGLGDARALAELELARGVACYYGAQVDVAAEPIARARDTAMALGDAALQAECEAWLGCIVGTLQQEPARSLAHLQAAARLGVEHRPLAAARALYVIATLYQEADLMDQAVRHYRRATLLARRENDEQLLAAVHRYMTLAQVQQIRRARAAGRLDWEQVKQAIASLGSAQQLAALLAGDDASLQFNLRLGEMLRLAGDHERALEVFEACVDRAARAGMTWEATIARADHAVCLAQAGRLLDASHTGALAEAELEPGYADYARAVVHDSLAELNELLGRPQHRQRHTELARAAWASDTDYCERLRAALQAQGPLTD